MSTSTTVDRGEFVETIVGEPTWQNPTKWESHSIAWKAGTPGKNADDLTAQALAALAANRTYVALASPSNAQVAAQVKALSRQVNGLIRVVLGQLDGTD